MIHYYTKLSLKWLYICYECYLLNEHTVSRFIATNTNFPQQHRELSKLKWSVQYSSGISEAKVNVQTANFVNASSKSCRSSAVLLPVGVDR